MIGAPSKSGLRDDSMTTDTINVHDSISSSNSLVTDQHDVPQKQAFEKNYSLRYKKAAESQQNPL
jgi:hypothetical protein